MCMAFTEWYVPREVPEYEALRAMARRDRSVDPKAIEACLVLVSVAANVLAAFNRHLARSNISQGRFVVLATLDVNSDAEMCCSDLALRNGVSRATMTGLLDGLERDGLVRRVDHPGDRRRTAVVLTPAGRRYLDKTLPDYLRRGAELMAHLAGKDKAQLIKLLGKVKSGIPALLKP